MGLNFSSSRFCSSPANKTAVYPKGTTPHQKLAPKDFGIGPYCAGDLYAGGVFAAFACLLGRIQSIQ